MARLNRVIAGPRRPWDLVIIFAITVTAVLLSIMLPSSPLVWFFGFVAIFYCPGYAIMAALLPGRMEVLSRIFIPHQERTSTITMLERSALSIGLSIATVALASTIMARGLVDLNALSVGLAIIVITLIASIVAIYRRSKLPPGDQFIIEYSPRDHGRFNQREATIAALILVSIVILGLVVSDGLTAHQVVMPYSEFEMTSVDGDLEHLPSSLSPSQAAAVKVTITNNLGRAADYVIIMSLADHPSGNTQDMSGEITLSDSNAGSMAFHLGDGESHSQILTFGIASRGNHIVHLFLIEPGNSEIMTLWLPISVR